jgi:hypothetical protein
LAAAGLEEIEESAEHYAELARKYLGSASLK